MKRLLALLLLITLVTMSVRAVPWAAPVGSLLLRFTSSARGPIHLTFCLYTGKIGSNLLDVVLLTVGNRRLVISGASNLIFRSLLVSDLPPTISNILAYPDLSIFGSLGVKPNFAS